MGCPNDHHNYSVLHGPYRKAMFVKGGFSAGYNQTALPYDVYYTLMCSKCGMVFEVKISEWIDQNARLQA